MNIIQMHAQTYYKAKSMQSDLYVLSRVGIRNRIRNILILQNCRNLSYQKEEYFPLKHQNLFLLMSHCRINPSQNKIFSIFHNI